MPIRTLQKPAKRYEEAWQSFLQECGCFESKDIGAYGTCPHGCIYCYANTNAETALRNHSRHNLYGDIL